jgi:hypothetical protein
LWIIHSPLNDKFSYEKHAGSCRSQLNGMVRRRSRESGCAYTREMKTHLDAWSVRWMDGFAQFIRTLDNDDRRAIGHVGWKLAKMTRYDQGSQCHISSFRIH